MKILITGANGLLGQELILQLLEKKYEVVATGRGPARLIIAALEGFSYQDLDITNGPEVEEFILKERPQIIVHAAAMTQVDQCELHKQDCYNINVTATRFIIDAAKAIGAKFVYVSTDFIFDGMSGPYKEDDEPAPVNYYGSTKLVAEKAVMESGLHWAIARTILVYGLSPSTGRTNIISWIKQNLESSLPIKMVTDQWRTPTFVHDLARGIALIIEKDATGIFHLSGDEQMTPYEMAVETAKFFGLNTALIEKAASPDIKQPAIRPARTGFVITKAKKELGFEPVSFMEGLKVMFV
jgi:dTDP-4-dehydrorhamnose reductase